MLAAAFVYVSALGNPFVYDDWRLVDENRSLVDVSDIRTIVLHDVTRPLVNLSYAVDRAAWGSSPFGFHLTSVALHVLNVGLLFALAWRLIGDRERSGEMATLPAGRVTGAFVAAALFAVHPLMTEAVSYVTGRAELMAGGFVLAALLAGHQWLAGGRTLWLAVAVLSWLCGQFSKETAVMFPFLLFAYERLVRRAPARRSAINALMGVSVLVAAVRIAIFVAIEQGDLPGVQWQLGFSQIDVVRRYIVLVLAPAGQSVFHAVAPLSGVPDLRWLLAGVTIGGVLTWAGLVRRSEPLAAWGLLWFLLVLLPPAMLVFLDHGEPMAERRTYLAACGLFVAIAISTVRLNALLTRRPGRARLVLRVALVMLLVSFAGRTIERNHVWANPVALWAEAVSLAPSHWLPQLGLGDALHEAGRHTQAVRAFQRSIALYPDEPAAYGKLGICLLETGDVDGAENAFTRLAALDAHNAQASNGLATVALARGEHDAARTGYLRTLALDPLDAAAQRALQALAGIAGEAVGAMQQP